MKLDLKLWYIGPNLLREVYAKGYTLTSFAEMVNRTQSEIHITQPGLSNIVANNQRVKGRQMEIFAEILGIKPEELIDESRHDVVIHIETQHGNTNGKNYEAPSHNAEEIVALKELISAQKGHISTLEGEVSHLRQLLDSAMQALSNQRSGK